MQPVTVAHAALVCVVWGVSEGGWAALVIYLTRAWELAASNFHSGTLTYSNNLQLRSTEQRHLIWTWIQKYILITLVTPSLYESLPSGDVLRSP